MKSFWTFERCLVSELKLLRGNPNLSVADDLFPAAMGIIEHYLKFSFKDIADTSPSDDDMKERFKIHWLSQSWLTLRFQKSSWNISKIDIIYFFCDQSFEFLKLRIINERVVLLIDRLQKSKFLCHPSLKTEIDDKIKAALTKRIADENISDCKLSLIHFDHTPNLINLQGSIQLRFLYSGNYFLSNRNKT